MNQQYDPNPLKDISPQEAIYLSQSKDEDVRRNACEVLACYQQHVQDHYKQMTSTQSQLSTVKSK